MRAKNNESESFLLRPLGRFCRQVAFKLDGISPEGTDEVRMIQEKKNCEQRHENSEWSSVAEHMGAVSEKTRTGHWVGHMRGVHRF